MTKSLWRVLIADTLRASTLAAQRLELIQLMLKKTGARGFGKLVNEGIRDLSPSDRHDLMKELLPQAMPLPRPLAMDVLSSTASTGAEAQFVLLQRVHECIPASDRGQMLVELLASTEGGLDEAADTLADTLHLAICLLYTSPSPRDRQKSRMPSSA